MFQGKPSLCVDLLVELRLRNLGQELCVYHYGLNE
jgi:hypothetical protein